MRKHILLKYNQKLIKKKYRVRLMKNHLEGLEFNS
jgi:hypothetical protein